MLKLAAGIVAGFVIGASILSVNAQPAPPQALVWPPADWPYAATDYDFEGGTNAIDIALSKQAFGGYESQDGFNAVFDLDRDGRVTAIDIALTKRAFGT